MSQRLVLCALAIAGLTCCTKPATDAGGAAPAAEAASGCPVEGAWHIATLGSGSVLHNIAADGSVSRPESPQLTGAATIDEFRHMSVTIEDPQFSGRYEFRLDETCRNGEGTWAMTRGPGAPANGEATIKR